MFSSVVEHCDTSHQYLLVVLQPKQMQERNKEDEWKWCFRKIIHKDTHRKRKHIITRIPRSYYAFVMMLKTYWGIRFGFVIHAEARRSVSKINHRHIHRPSLRHVPPSLLNSEFRDGLDAMHRLISQFVRRCRLHTINATHHEPQRLWRPSVLACQNQTNILIMGTITPKKIYSFRRWSGRVPYFCFN